MLEEDIAEVLIDADAIQARVAELGAQLNADYDKVENPLLVCVLKGAFVFLADLTRHLNFPHEVDFMATSSYGAATETTGVVRILMDLDRPVEGRHVLIVEDIIDSGYTLEYMLRMLSARNPASLRICTLLSKPERRQVDVPVQYVGFDIPNKFVVGYGLDFGERYRNLPFIGVLKPELYQNDA
jgi:hypoxanthine phosphoribosyltransferase